MSINLVVPKVKKKGIWEWDDPSSFYYAHKEKLTSTLDITEKGK